MFNMLYTWFTTIHTINHCLLFLTFIGKKQRSKEAKKQGDEKQDINFALTLPPLLSLYYCADLQDDTLRTISSARLGQPWLDVLFHCHNSSWCNQCHKQMRRTQEMKNLRTTCPSFGGANSRLVITAASLNFFRYQSHLSKETLKFLKSQI